MGPAPARAAPRHDGIELPGDANGIAWDAATATLYIADGANAQIEQWTDRGGFAPVGACPPAAAGSGSAANKLSLGGLVKTRDGFVTLSFGFGTAGAVFVIGDGPPRAVPGLDPVRRRLGIARAPDGTLYDTYVVVANGTSRGGVARLDRETGETDVVAIAGKPVGVVATADTLYVSEQDKSEILAFARAAPGAGEPRVIAHDLPGVDLLEELPGGDLVTGGKRGTVTRVRVATGDATPIASGFDQVRGVAYDAAKKRLFVVEHSRATSRQHLYIVPYDAGAGAGAARP